MVMHSATKYLGGHSDMLLGVLMVSQPETRRELIMKRIRFGAVPGNMECWLLLRSLRTLTLRVERQTKTATYLTNALFTAVQNQAHSSLSARESQTIRLVVEEVFYPGLRSSKEELAWLTKQMPGGFGGTFALQLKTKDAAEALVKSCKYWKNATSLGGVESLSKLFVRIEIRAIGLLTVVVLSRSSAALGSVGAPWTVTTQLWAGRPR